MSTKATVLRGAAAGHAQQAVHDHLTKAPGPAPVGLSALEEAEAARSAILEQAYQEGLERARLEVEGAMEDANQRVRRALAALCVAVDSFDQRQTIALADVEDAIVTGAFGIARAIVERELTVAVDPGADALARAMHLAPERGDVLARLNPADVETLSMEDISTATRTVKVIADPTIEAGGCIVEVADTRVDAQLSTAFAHVQTALFGDEEPAVVMPKKAAGSTPKNSRTTASEAPYE